MSTQQRKLVQRGLRNAVKAYHKLGYNSMTELHPNIKDAFHFLDEVILDLKESLGYERSGDWNKVLKP